MKHAGEIFLINAYTNTVEKTDMLRDLIKSIVNNGYEVCLVTHTQTPQDIIERCDYFIYDRRNPLIFDPEYQYWCWHRNDNYEIVYISPKAKIHFLPYYRSMFAGLRYLNTFGYEIVHSFDFDIQIDNFKFIRNNVSLLEKYDAVGYLNTNGDIFCHYSLNLRSIDIPNLKYNEGKLKAQYLDYRNRGVEPTVEKLLWGEYLPGNVLIQDASILSQSTKSCLSNFADNDDNFDATLFVFNDSLYLFVNNYGKTDIVVDVLYNGLVPLNVPKNSTNYYYVGRFTDSNVPVKIYTNNRLYIDHQNLEFFIRHSQFTLKG